MTLNSKLFIGRVCHKRYRPRRHTLRYSVFSLLLDLDELSSVDRQCKMLTVNRPGLLSFWEGDHGTGRPGGLKKDLQQLIAAAGIAQHAERIEMLCFPRMFGYVFNPITAYFCRSASGDLQTMVYEVNNTFGGRHFYVVEAGMTSGGIYFHSAAKAFYVSPFNHVEGDYTFRVMRDGNNVAIGISLKVDGLPLLNAHQTGRIEPLNDRGLLTALRRMPLMTFKVIAGIHIEALRLWLKGLRTTPRAPESSSEPEIASNQRALTHD